MKPKRSKRKHAAKQKAKIDNLYLRPRQIKRADFLLLVDGRDTPEFQREFAEWLANGCTLDLVRRCFEEEPRRQVERLRTTLLPPAFVRLKKSAHSESNLHRREKLLRDMDRVWPQIRLQPSIDKLIRRSEEVRQRYKQKLVRELTERSAADQIEFLNRHLKQANILPPAKPASCYAPVPKSGRGVLSNRPPRSIALSAVEDAYYEAHPALKRHEHEWKRLMREAGFGRALAKRMARATIPGEALALEEIGQALAVLPDIGKNSKPVLIGLACRKEIGAGDKKRVVCAVPLRELLKLGFGLSPKGVRSFVAAALHQHLELLNSTGLGHFKAVMRAGRNINTRIKQLAGTNRELAKTYRQIHRAARYAPQLVGALQEFFFRSLPLKELRTRPALVVKLTPAFRKDVSLLGRFLFQKKSKGKFGLIPSAIEIDKPGSQFLRKLTMHQTWPKRVQLKREGKKDAELAADADKLAGVPLELIAAKGYVVAAERLREREGLTYPR